MNSDWKAFLIDNGAKFSDEQLISFGDAELAQKAPPHEVMLSDLSDFGLIKVFGEDAESFLQNQLSNDIRNVSDTMHQISAWCTPKGRIIATFRIFQRQDSYYLSVSADLLEHVIKKLRMYVMMSKVTIEDASDALIHFSYSGSKTGEKLQKILALSTPIEPNQTLQSKDLSILHISGNIDHYEVFGSINDAKDLWNSCKTEATLSNSNRWYYLNILAGNPHIDQASSESWIPQMVNYIAVDGVDFKKGCYPGQEVVARLNYLGKTKRRMYHLLINTNTPPAVNDVISSTTDKDAGKILNAVINSDGKVEALAVLKIAEASNGLTLANDDTVAISLLDLPYTLDE